MFQVFGRYLLREAFQAWLLVTFVLLFILMSNQFAQVLGDAAADRLPKETVFQVIGLSSFQFLTILIPAGLFIACMTALARLYRDNEMAAIMACGVGPCFLYRPLFVLALLLSGLVGWLSLEIAPRSIARIAAITEEAQRQADLATLEAGRFITPSGGDMALYAERVGEDGLLSNIFLQRQIDGRLEVIVADRGERVERGDGVAESFVLYDGRRYEGRPGGMSFTIMDFVEHGIPLPEEPSEPGERAIEAIPTAELLDSSELGARAELQWRVSVPLSLFVLTLLAVPLSRSDPRQGRYAKVAIGVLVYIVYNNMLGAARVWFEGGQLPEWLGLWWVHVVVIAIALVLLSRQTGWWVRTGPVAVRA